MDDFISRQAAVDTLKMDYTIIPYTKAREYVKATLDEIWNRLDKLPTAVQERPKGKWINAKCSACGNLAPFWPMASTYYHTNYCPHCGVDMREEENGND